MVVCLFFFGNFFCVYLNGVDGGYINLFFGFGGNVVVVLVDLVYIIFFGVYGYGY